MSLSEPKHTAAFACHAKSPRRQANELPFSRSNSCGSGVRFPATGLEVSFNLVFGRSLKQELTAVVTNGKRWCKGHFEEPKR